MGRILHEKTAGFTRRFFHVELILIEKIIHWYILVGMKRLFHVCLLNLLVAFCLTPPGQGADAPKPRTGPAIQGYAYFLPQSDSANAYDWVRNFVKAGWKQEMLEDLQKSQWPLYSPRFCLPPCRSEFVYSAFSLPPSQAGSPYMVLYQGTVMAPENGFFRFVGMGDETLLVNFGGRNVLEAGFILPSDKTNSASPQKIKSMFRTLKKSQMKVPGATTWNEEAGGLYCGSVFQVEKDRRYAIRILYSDSGGRAGLCLLMQRYGQEKPSSENQLKLPEGEKLDLFRTGGTLPKKEMFAQLYGVSPQSDSLELPEFREDSLVWPSCVDAPDAALDAALLSVDFVGETEIVQEEEEAKPARKNKKKGKRKKKKKKKA